MYTTEKLGPVRGKSETDTAHEPMDGTHPDRPVIDAWWVVARCGAALLSYATGRATGGRPPSRRLQRVVELVREEFAA
jgi:hypothetical protein